jgi:hypothetical protein
MQHILEPEQRGSNHRQRIGEMAKAASWPLSIGSAKRRHVYKPKGAALKLMGSCGAESLNARGKQVPTMLVGISI